MIDKIEKFAAEKISITKIEFNALFVLISISIISIIYNHFDSDNLSSEEKQNLIAVLDSIALSKSQENKFDELQEIESSNKFDEYNENKEKLVVDIRTASDLQLMKLPNIGEKTAQNIIEYRNINGFSKTSDLLKVKGIGPKTFNKMKPNLVMFGENSISDDNIKDNDITYSSIENDKLSLQNKININQATKEDLIKLPGIGEATADRIIEYRMDNKFETIEDIKKVKGIRQKKFEKIKNFIEVR